MLRLRRCLKIAAVPAILSAAILPFEVLAANSITLDQAIARALQIAPAIQAAAAQSELSGGRVEEAQAPFYPWITAGGDYNQTPGYSKPVTNGGLTLAQLALTYNAFDGGRRRALLRSARYAAEAARLGIGAAQAQIVFDITVAYFNLLRQRDIETELASSVSRLARYVAIVEALLRSGRAIPNDVLTIRMARDSAELARAAAHQAAVQASIALSLMIGDATDLNLQPAEVAALPALPGGDFSRSPAYQAAARQVQASKLAVDAARAERSPNLNLTLTSGWEGINPPTTFGRHLGASYDGAVTVPLFQGGLVRSHIDQASAAEHAALAQQQQIELQVKRDLADADSSYRSALDQLSILRAAQQSAGDAFGLAWTRFLGGGNITLLEVISAYQQRENLRTARFDQTFNARQAAAQARMILGLVR
jgi:outer membrane protein TolC